jgi:hypothetical protein
MIKTNVESMTQLVAVGGGLAFPDKVINEADLPFDLFFEVDYSHSLRRYWVRSLRFEAHSDAMEVTMRYMNRLALQEFLSTGLGRLAVFDIAKRQFTKGLALEYSTFSGGVSNSGWESLERDFYVTYRVGEVLNRKPTQHLATVHEIPYSTAADRLGKFRKSGKFNTYEDSAQDQAKLMAIPRPYVGDPVVDGQH